MRRHLMETLKFIFWISALLIFYTYIGYFLLLKFISLIIKRHQETPNTEVNLMSVTIVITAHNEEKLIERRIDNCLKLDYPNDLLEIIIASDGSTDRTNEIVLAKAREYPNIKLLHIPSHKGRAFILNNAIKKVNNEIILFSDANTLFNEDYLLQIIKAFNDPEVGCVGGQLTYANFNNNIITQNESLYWKVESKIRQLESELGILTSVSGCNFAIRKKLFTPISLAHEIDDIYPYRSIKAGFKVIHQRRAKAFEDSPETIGHQLYSRERILIQGLPGILNEIKDPFFLKNPRLLFSVISHRFIRWISPLFLIILLISNTFMLSIGFYRFLFTLQILFMLSGLIGLLFNTYKRKVKIIGSLFAFYLANLGFLLGLIKLIGNVRMSKY